jgi:hypothetical protein
LETKNKSLAGYVSDSDKYSSDVDYEDVDHGSD